MKIAVDCGHTLRGADYGAVGLKAESNLTREVGNKVISKLKALGHIVINCTKDTCSNLGESLSYRVNTANNSNADLFISIHFNCFNKNAHGTEVLTYGGKEFTEATRVLNNIVALGYESRGIKDGNKLYVLRNTKMKSMLIECAFCDSKKDMDIFNSENMANSIVKGLVGQTTNSQPFTPAPTQNNDWISLDGKTGTCIGNDVRVRSSKTTSTNTNILGLLHKGDKVRLYRKEGDWIHIYYPIHGGYVSKDYIKLV